MCGIAGIFRTRVAAREDETHVRAMNAALQHRGPDAGGVWSDPEAGVTLGHRRLAVIDPTDAAAQPCVSASGRYVLTFNGEVYNYREIAAALRHEGVRLADASGDTEVLAALIDQVGVTTALPRLNGMFALAVFDTRERRLHLVRDRIGIKPLYVAQLSDGVAFASELGALARCAGVSSRVDPEAVASYMRHGYVPAPLSMLQGTSKLMPAEHRVYEHTALAPTTTSAFWQAPVYEPAAMSDAEVLGQLDVLLADSVRLRTVSDVPLGAFLSGGIDSSLVVAHLARQSSSPVRTFCVGFDDAAYDESARAQAIAAHLGTQHTAVRLSADHAMDAVAAMPATYTEPFADSSQLATWMVSRAARQHVTVALSGDGGDELFGGYDRYVWGRRAFAAMRRAPTALLRAARMASGALSPDVVDRVFGRVEDVLPASWRVQRPGHKAQKLARLVGADSAAAFHAQLACIWLDPDLRLPADPGFRDMEPDVLVSYMSHRDLREGLPDDMLTKLDRASMSASLEVRVPLLDHRIVALSRTLAPTQWIRDGVGKWAPRTLLARDLPPDLMSGPKSTFSVPLAAWLRGPLKDWAAELLRAPQAAYVNWPAARALWAEHQAGRALHTERLWSYLMVESWERSRGGA